MAILFYGMVRARALLIRFKRFEGAALGQRGAWNIWTELDRTERASVGPVYKWYPYCRRLTRGDATSTIRLIDLGHNLQNTLLIFVSQECRRILSKLARRCRRLLLNSLKNRLEVFQFWVIGGPGDSLQFNQNVETASTKPLPRILGSSLQALKSDPLTLVVHPQAIDTDAINKTTG